MNKKSNPATVAVIGAGYWGRNLVRNFHTLDSLATICDSDPDTLAALADQYPGTETTTDPAAVFTNPGIQAVAIAAPAAAHYDLALKALDADKDVFIEKPIALTYDEGREIVQKASAKNRILMVGHILEYHPAVMKLKDMVKNGVLGKINYIYSNRLNLGKFRTEENILWSFAPHDISVILSLLNEMPEEVSAHGGNYLNSGITDVTVTNMAFPSGTKAHIFVSWLHPYKEQKLIIIGDKKMVMFDDVDKEHKLYAFAHEINWKDRIPTPNKKEAEPIPINNGEPLKAECAHFLDCIQERKQPLTDGPSGLRVLQVLEQSQKSLSQEGTPVSLKKADYFVHPSSYIDPDVEIGEGTKIWHFSHVLSHSKIGKKCSLGQNVVVGPNVTIGNNVKIQNNVSVYDGVTLEDDVFCGPSMVFTNVTNPRSHWPRKDEYKKTVVKQGASIGANATIVCGITIGRYAFIGAGAVVNKDVPDYALVYGVPAQVQGWMCYCGRQLIAKNLTDNRIECELCGRVYVMGKDRTIREQQ
jgi:UDP-2-acetamido-3-amino-2,3-dideoxy-glucuronate N-acetyltransferase